tara:strand:- start:1914 stop:2252 length:339 start_codon:yes stop_codon:yes gene_type:complete
MEKARKKKEEQMKQFKEKVEGKTQSPINTHKTEKPIKKVSYKKADNYDDDFLFKNMERVIGLVERLTTINNNTNGGYRQAIRNQPKSIPIQQSAPINIPKPKIELHGYDDFF